MPQGEPDQISLVEADSGRLQVRGCTLRSRGKEPNIVLKKGLTHAIISENNGPNGAWRIPPPPTGSLPGGRRAGAQQLSNLCHGIIDLDIGDNFADFRRRAPRVAADAILMAGVTHCGRDLIFANPAFVAAQVPQFRSVLDGCV